MIKVFTTFNNKQMEISLIRALAKLGQDTKIVESEDQADVLILVQKGGNFGQEDLEKYQKSPTAKVVVTDRPLPEEMKVDRLILAEQNSGQLKVKMSEIAAAVIPFAPMEFVIEDDLEEPEMTEVPRPPEKSAEAIQEMPGPTTNNPMAEELQKRLAQVLQADRSEKAPLSPVQQTDHTKDQRELEKFLSQAEKICVLSGVKGGVGTSTVAAMLTYILSAYVPLHLELAEVSSAAYYYGKSLEQALAQGQYATSNGEQTQGQARPAKILLLDLGADLSPELKERAWTAAHCRILVTDRDETAFRLTGVCLTKQSPDILVVNKTFPGLGNGLEVYQGEYAGVLRAIPVIGLPGTIHEEQAIQMGQRMGTSMLGSSIELDASAGELAAQIRNRLNI